MARREEYNSCMRPYISGKGKSKQDRKNDFCIGAKICSGKAADRNEAERLCAAPKPEKPFKMSKRQKRQVEDACRTGEFLDVARQFKNIYITAQSDGCVPCGELDELIRKTDIPHQVVYVPGSCTEILNTLGVDSFPTVVKMSKGKVVARHTGMPAETIEKMRLGQ